MLHNDLFSIYTSDENTRLGINIHFLELFHSEGILLENSKEISSLELKGLIKHNEALLSKKSFIEYCEENNNKSLMTKIHNFLQLFGLHIKQDLRFLPRLIGDWEQMKDWRYLSQISMVNAFFYHLGLPTGHEDYKSRLPKLSNDRYCFYQMDMEFEFWPINRIIKNIYAAKGFEGSPISIGISVNQIAEKKQFLPIGFLFDILNFEHHNSSAIKYIVAIGEVGVDFPGYFLKDGKFKCGEYEIHVKPTLDTTNKINSEFTRYKLNCDYYISDKLTHNKTLSLLHIPTPDRRPVFLSNESLVTLVDLLLSALHKEEDILVHCQAGMGRTGYLIFLLRSLYKKIFEKNGDRNDLLTEIVSLINEMREKRPGLILEKEQMYYAVKDCIRYLHLKSQLNKKDTVSWNSLPIRGLNLLKDMFIQNSNDLDDDINPNTPLGRRMTK